MFKKNLSELNKNNLINNKPRTNCGFSTELDNKMLILVVNISSYNMGLVIEKKGCRTRKPSSKVTSTFIEKCT